MKEKVKSIMFGFIIAVSIAACVFVIYDKFLKI